MGHEDKHCPEFSDWHNAPRQYGDWLRANGKMGTNKSRLSSSGERDENGGDRDAENVQTTVRKAQAMEANSGEGSSGNSGKQALSDKGSMMGCEVTGSPMCQSTQKPDGWNSPIQVQTECAYGQTTPSRANLGCSPIGPSGVMDKDMGTDHFVPVMSQQSNNEKGMMDVSSSIMLMASPTSIKAGSEDNLSPKEEQNGKAKRHWKKNSKRNR